MLYTIPDDANMTATKFIAEIAPRLEQLMSDNTAEFAFSNNRGLAYMVNLFFRKRKFCRCTVFIVDSTATANSCTPGVAERIHFPVKKFTSTALLNYALEENSIFGENAK